MNVLNTTDFRFEMLLDGDHPVLRHHHVHGRPLVPGVTWLGLIVQALREADPAAGTVVLEDILFREPLSLRPSQQAAIEIRRDLSDGLVRVRVLDTGAEVCRCRIAAVPLPVAASACPPVPPLGAMVARPLAQVYAQARSLDIRHGPWMAGQGTAYLGEGIVVADITLSDEARAQSAGFALHPALLDCATLVPFAAGGFGKSHATPAIPLAVRRFTAFATGFDKARIVARLSGAAVHNDDILHNDLWLIDENGRVLAQFEQLSAKRIRSAEALLPAATSVVTASNTTAPVSQSATGQSLEDQLLAFVSAATGRAVKTDTEVGFYEMGLGSTDLLNLSAELEARLGRTLYPTLLYEYGSVALLAGWLREQGIVAFPGAELSRAATTETTAKDDDLTGFVARIVAELAGLAAVPDADMPLYDMGLDSGALMALAKAFEDSFGQTFYPTLCYEYGSVRALADHFASLGLTVPAANDAKESASAVQIEATLHRAAEVWAPAPLPQGAKEIAGWVAIGGATNHHDLPEWSGQTGIKGLVWAAPEGPVEALLDAALGVAQRLIAAKLPLRVIVLASDRTAAAALAPFFRTLARETPRLSGRIIAGSVPDLQAELAAPGPERGFEWIDYSDDAATRQRQALTIALAEPVALVRPVEGAILIIGAQGAIAQHLIDAFHERGHRRFCLIGRRAATGDLADKLRHLVSNGVEIQELQADVADTEALAKAWKAAKARFGSIGGILHCAGVLRDGFLADKRPEDAQTVLAVKLPPLQKLDELSRGEPLAFFAACGSITGVMGNVGQADYAFANGAMAGLLADRARLVAAGERAGASLCLNWPLWADGGMAPDARRSAQLAAETGLAPLPTAEAVATLFAAMAEPGNGLITPLMIETGAEARFEAFASGTGLAMGKAAELPPTVNPVTPTLPKAPLATAADMPVAVIGMAGEYPGARDLDELWANLLAGQDAITPVPQDRWDHAALLGEGRGTRGKIYARDGGFIADHDRFDAAFFNIPPREARLLDPQERRFLQTAWQTVESAGLNPRALDGAAVGVFVGAMWGQYQLQGADAEGSVAASIYAAIANRVSYSLNLTGPSLALDSMCSSSLSALHLAMESLRRGECRMAIAGGVNLMSHPHKYRFLCQNQMLSDDGRCRSFGEGGNGYVPGEGVGAVLLKPLDQALADGDPIQAVLLASALNHGGRGAGMTVPNPAAQAKVIRRAHEAAGTLDRVSYIEAHGTGTSLGDPIEVEGIRQAFAGSGLTDCALGSVKSNIGHLEGAAGIAALAKVVLQLRHSQLVPSLHADVPNSKLRLEDSPLRLQRELTDWNGTDRVAGISAFGAGGSNAHLVVGAAPDRAATVVQSGPALLVISARDADTLRRYAERWVTYLSGAVARALPFAAIAATSVSGRAQMACRLAVVANDHVAASALLSGWLAGVGENAPLVAPMPMEFSQAALTLATKAATFLKGEPLAIEPGPRVEIPVYPFGGDRHWLETAASEAVLTQTADPLLHNLVPTLDGVGYESRWTAEEVLLDQHMIAGRRLMPAAMMLETARHALAMHLAGGRIALASARIGMPFAVEADKPADLSTSVFANGRGLAVELRPAGSEAIVLQVQSAPAPLALARLTPPEAAKDTGSLYPAFAGAGLAYGLLYRSLSGVAEDGAARWAKIDLPAEQGWRRGVLALDAAMQAVVLCGTDLAIDETAWLPSEFEGLEWHGDTADAVWVRVEPLSDDLTRRCYALTLTDAAGHPLWRASRFTLRPVPKLAVPVSQFMTAGSAATVADPGATRDALRACLCDMLAAESGLSADHVRRENAFAALGVDSVMVMKMTFSLEERLGSLPKSLFFDCPGINELTDWLLSEKAGALPVLLGDIIAKSVSAAVMPETAAPSRGAPMLTSLRKKFAEALHQEPLAVIGMSGRFPDADGVDALWENLSQGRNSVRRIPEDRWPADLFRNEDGRKGNICDFGGFLDDVAGFDADFFGMTPIDAKRADPAERILLETAWSAAEDAGYSRKSLKGRPVGVFVASMWQQYQHFGVDAVLRGEQMSAVSLLSSTASRISGMLGVNGPCLALDTMCSGSLTALHLARQAISSGDCEAAIVGGVNLSLHPHKYLTLSAGGFLSRAGHCAAFGATADGYVPGEGSACIMVKPLSRALADGDPVHGVILGTAINHIGTVNGSTIPSATAQAKVIARALEAAGIDPKQVSYVEAHGTGTALGDPIELEGLDSALNADGAHPGCHLGSIKSNLGHAEAAAGMIGIVKVLLQFRHQKLAPTLHIEKTNPVLELDRKPFHLVDRLQDWQPGAEKFAAVSAFGAGGSNANVILQSPPQRELTIAHGSGSQLFTFSARGDTELQAQLRNIRDWLAGHPDADLQAVSATLLLGREDQARRIAVLAADHATLLARLDACLNGKAQGADIFAGGAEPARIGDLFDDAEGQAMVRRLVETRRLAKLAQLWASGVAVDWASLFATGQPRLSMPGSVFNRIPLMFPHMLEAYAVRFENTSDLHGQSYHIEMPAAHPVITDHVIDGRRQVSLALMMRLAHEALTKADADENWQLSLKVLRPWFVADRLVCDITLDPAAGGLRVEILADGSTIASGMAKAAVAPAVPTHVMPAKGTEGPAIYAQFAADGYEYGPCYRGLSLLTRDGETMVARLAPAVGNDPFGAGRLPVAALDAALQATRPVLDGGGQIAWLPVEVELGFGPAGIDGCAGAVQLVSRLIRKSEVDAEFVLYWLDASGDAVAYGRAVLMARAVPVELDKALVLRRVSLPTPLLTGQVAAMPRQRIQVAGTDTLAVPGVSRAATLGDVLGSVETGISALSVLVSSAATASGLMELWSFVRSAREAGIREMDLILHAEHMTPHLAGMTAWFSALQEEIAGYRGRILIAAGPLDMETAFAAPTQQAVCLIAEEKGWQIPGSAVAVLENDQAFAPKGHVVLITGGAGGLGRLFAQHLAARFGVHPVLVGRKAEDDAIRSQIANLRALGVEASYYSADIADPAQAARLRRKIALRYGRLDGVIHAAGVTADAWLTDQTEDGVRRVLAPKVEGTDRLIDLVRPFAPQWVASFASISGYLGNPGQTDYSYANAYMDEALKQGLGDVSKVVCLSWPLWKDIGMQVDPKMLAVMDKRYGMQPLPAATGLALFEKVMAGPSGQRLITFGDPERIGRWLAGKEAGLQALAQVQGKPVPASIAVAAPVAASAHVAAVAVPQAGRSARDIAREWVAAAVFAETQITADRLDWARPIDQFGISSVMSTSIVAQLETHTGSSLPATLMFECQTWAEVADWLCANCTIAAAAPAPQLQAQAASPSQAITPKAEPRRKSGKGYRFGRSQAEIAIVGAACRMPGAPDMAAFWRLLASGSDAVTEIPASRWRWQDHAPDAQAQAMRGGFLTGVENFDYPFFGMFHKEARSMDPQERLVLETAWHALEDAGIRPSTLSDQPVGVYMGAMWNQYQMLARDLWETAPTEAAANGSMAAVSNRLSFLLNLTGPSLTLDTMCSSSLMALKLASDALKAGEIEMAIVGGVNLSVHPFKYHQLQQAHFLSPEGRCGAFAAGGDGYVPSEGVGVVILRRHEDARAGGDRVRALVRGIGVSHGGRANGFTVPRPQKQAAAIRAALRDGGINANSVSYVEAHGTGTALGDPIEMTGLKSSYLAEGDFPLAIGSVKTNIGHAEAAAGMASLCKVLLQLEHRQLAPSIHAEPANPDLGIDGTGIRVQKVLADWQNAAGQTGPLRAGISGFGAGGTNVHVVIEEAPVATPLVAANPGKRSELVLLSAHDSEQLRDVVRRFRAHAANSGAGLPALAAATQLSRDALKVRLAVLAADAPALLAALETWLNSPVETTIAGLWQGRVDIAGLEPVEGRSLDNPDDAAHLVETWACGAGVDWAALWPAETLRDHLPLYPFKALPVWVGDGLEGTVIAAPRKPVAMVAAAPQPVRIAAPVAVIADPTDVVLAVIGGIFRTPPEDIPLDATFDRIGMDSVAAAECAKALSQRLGLTIDPTWFFNHPTVRQLAAEIGRVQPAAAPAEVAQTAPALPALVPASTDEAIAIIGMSGAFAGSPDLDSFWENLVAGRDCVTEVDSSRWDISAHHDPRPGQPGKTVARRMGQLAGIDMFDPAAFGLMPDEVEAMDPQQRLFLKHATMALDDAALSPERIDGVECGVFAGTMTGTFRAFLDGEERGNSALAMLGNHAAALPARVAFWLNLTGPTLALDTACSSSLVSVHLACQSLLQGESALAIAGGVFVAPGPQEMVSSSQAGMLSPDGCCKTFDDTANGIAMGEGVGVVVLKRLSQALADGDPIAAVIRASGINQDGRTNGLTAPNALSQARLIERVMARAGLTGEAIDYVECHGTGTRLGDPVEVEGLRRAFAGSRQTPLPIGSVKPNIGHCYAAAGVASLLKVILSLRHGQIPPSIHCNQPNGLIDFAAAGVEVTTRLRDWPQRGAVRRGSVSAFGYTGTNAHLIVEEAPARHVAAIEGEGQMVILPISARKPALVVAQARALAERLARGDLVLSDVARALQLGRREEACRWTVAVGDIGSARKALLAVTEADVIRAARGAGAEQPATNDPAVLAAAWMKGARIVWPEASPAARRAAVPGKAYDERRVWPEQVEVAVAKEAAVRPAAQATTRPRLVEISIEEFRGAA